MSKPAMPKPHKKRTGHLSKEDMNLWQKVQRTVDPLEGREANFAEFLADFEGSDESTPRAKPSSPTSIRTNETQSSPPRRFPVAPYSPPVSKPRSGAGAIDDKTARKLLKGKLSIEDRIDLHGMTQDQAHRMLGSFLARSHASGKRIVLVITGKGRMSDGILRQLVPQWLREPQLSIYVSAFRMAHITHGGEGALYVRLRRTDRGMKRS